jgi:thioredoxin 1
MAINSVIHTNQHSVDRVINAGLPVLLIFWRPDSPASKQLDPTLDKLAADFAGRALIAKVDVTDEQALVSRYNIAQAPSIVFIKGGAAEGTAAGAADERALTAWLTYLVDGGAKPALPSGPSESINGSAGAYPTYTNGSPGHGNGESRPQGSGKPVTLTDANFDRIVHQPGPVLVDFWAPWCGPCRMVAPAVEQLASEFAGQATVGKLNVDENPMIAQRYGIMSIPALYIFKNGEVVDRIVGAQPAAILRQRLARHI